MKRSTLLLLSLGCAGAAFAQSAEVSLNAGESMLRNKSLGNLTASDNTVAGADFGTNFHLSLKMTLNSWKFFGQEFGYNYNRGSIKAAGSDVGGMPVHQGFYDLLAYATKEGKKIRPFAGAGVHFSSFFPPGASVFNGNGITKFGFNYGGGVKVRVSDAFLVRRDAHDYETPKPDLGLPNEKGWLHQLVVSAGVAFVF